MGSGNVVKHFCPMSDGISFFESYTKRPPTQNQLNRVRRKGHWPGVVCGTQRTSRMLGEQAVPAGVLKGAHQSEAEEVLDLDNVALKIL